MKLSEEEIETLIKVCQLTVEQAFKDKIKRDEYFKRGFLLGCQELTACLIHKLKRYDIIPPQQMRD